MTGDCSTGGNGSVSTGGIPSSGGSLGIVVGGGGVGAVAGGADSAVPKLIDASSAARMVAVLNLLICRIR